MNSLKKPPYEEYRYQFLMKMYDQLMNDINRHLSVIWQSVSVLVSSLALFALAENDIIPIDIATVVIIMLVGWFLAHLYDAEYWYNRNLVIIANIDRHFLKDSDKKDIHFYFTKHREKNELIDSINFVDAITKWNSTSQTSIGWINFSGGIGTNFELDPLIAYEVSITQNVDWTQE